ncbi:MAG TPA: DeoR/GlpR family DNA-binding transcription regulator [Caldilineaceae bacterium]|nr:DeoR/GlpR family DNA-binding transcription regulator [Caldilineaceae bacterium]
MTTLIAAERLARIKEILLQEGSVKTAELADRFRVSHETIRRDLTLLEQDGVIQKAYGGAILDAKLKEAMEAIVPVRRRKLQRFAEKDAIGLAAAALVQDGQIVVLDAGSTTWCVARHLKRLHHLTIITNSVDVVQECAQNGDLSLFVLGGKLNARSMCMVGPQVETELKRYHADVVFVGAVGVSLHKGLTSSDLYEAEVKRAMVEAGQKKVVVADHTKLQQQGLVSFAALADMDILITDDQADAAIVRQLERAGIQVIVCAPEPVSA